MASRPEIFADLEPIGHGSGRRLVNLILTATRLVMLIGISCLFLAAFALLVFGAVSTIRHIAMLLAPEGSALTNRQVFLASIKLVDLVLLATVLQVAGFSLFSLFINHNIPVPSWLRADDVDGLKHKLAGIVVVMLGVLYLEQVIDTPAAQGLLPMGLGVAAVILALSYFIRSHHHEDPD